MLFPAKRFLQTYHLTFCQASIPLYLFQLDRQADDTTVACPFQGELDREFNYVKIHWHQVCQVYC